MLFAEILAESIQFQALLKLKTCSSPHLVTGSEALVLEFPQKQTGEVQH